MCKAILGVLILTHSMGGLVARRYVLDNPDTHNVDKMVTIAAPWLGAPKVIYTIHNDSTASVTANFVLNSAKLNTTPTTTTLPTIINVLAAGETVTRILRFAATAAATNTRAKLSGTGTSQGTAFSGSVKETELLACYAFRRQDHYRLNVFKLFPDLC